MTAKPPAATPRDLPLRPWWQAAVGLCWVHVAAIAALALLIGAAMAALLAGQGPTGTAPLALAPYLLLVVAVAVIPVVARRLLVRRRPAGAVVMTAYGGLLAVTGTTLATRNAVAEVDGARDLIVGVPIVGAVLGVGTVAVTALLLARVRRQAVGTDAP